MIPCCTWKALVRACLGSLFRMTEKSLLSGSRKTDGSALCLSRFWTVARMSISISCNEPRFDHIRGARATHLWMNTLMLNCQVLLEDFWLSGGRAAAG